MRLNRRGLGTGSRGQVLLAFASLVTVGAVALGLGSSTGQARPAGRNQIVQPALFVREPAPSTLGPQQVRVAYSHLPLIFELNQGQSDPRVKFLARGSGYGLFLTADEAVLALQHSAVSTQHSAHRISSIRMALDGAKNDAAVVGTDQLPGKSNYFIGNDSAKWHRDVPQFARVRYQSVYPGIDLVYYGNQGRLEYDFEVAPGGDPKRVVLQFHGADKLKLDADGNLLTLNAGDVRLEAPRVYQKIGEQPKPIAGRFVLLGKDKVGFELGPYDRSRTLVIDPVLTYSTYLGGSGDEACSRIAGITFPGTATVSPPSGCPAIAVDSAPGIGGPGNIYVAGSTTSSDFQPGVLGRLTGTANIFVAKFDPAGATLIFSTYLGGDGTDTSAGVAVDSALNVYVAGTTTSTNFPTTPSSDFQPGPMPAGTPHVFVSQLKPDGSGLLYSTYLAGNGTEAATGLALDVHFKVYVSGTTTSTNPPTTALFPATIGAFQTCPGEKNGNCPAGVTHQFFFSKLDPTLNGTASLVYSTYLGGSLPSGGVTMGGGIAVDTNASAPNVYLTGGTDFTDMPVLNAFQGMNGGGIDAWVAKFTPSNASGAQEIYLTYLGGTGNEIGNGVAVDSGGNVYITGSISTVGFTPTLPSGTVPFQSASGGGIDAFLAKFGSPCTGTSCTSTNVPLNYFSYLGGSGTDFGLAIAVDSIQGARLTGWTDSPNFHTQNPLPTGGAAAGGKDAFVARIDTTATSATAPGHFSTYLGGSGSDFGTGIAIDSQANTFVAGETASPPPSFPITSNALQSALHGPTDAFVSKLGPTVGLSMTQTPPTATPTTVGMGNQVTFKYTITNTGDLTTGITFSDTVELPPPAPATTFVSATASPGSCGSVVNGDVLCSIGTLNAGATATVTIVLTPTAPTTPNPGPVTLPNRATANVTGSTVSVSASAPSVTVNDFSAAVAPATSPPILAGTATTFTVTVTPTGAIPDTVALSCSSGLPTGATCTFPNGASIPDLNNGPQSRQLVINTTVRPTPTFGLWQPSLQRGEPGGPLYATWLPVSGLALLGMRKMSRKRRVLAALLLGGFFAFVLFQIGCGSTKKSPPPTGGTPAGTYTITVTATSGSATRTTQMQLVVQ